MLVKQMLRPESGGRICKDVIYYVNWGGYGCSCLIEMDILPLNPLFIRFLYPSQIHYSEVESTVSCKLLVRKSLLHETYHVFWGVDVPYDHVCDVGPQVGFEDRAHLLSVVYEHRLEIQQEQSKRLYSLFMIDASATKYHRSKRFRSRCKVQVQVVHC